MLPRCVGALFVFTFVAVMALCAQSSLTVNRTGVRSFAEAVRELRETTGWQLSLEEPVWPQTQRASVRTLIDSNGRQVEPPDEERIQFDVPALTGATARRDAVVRMVNAYNSQNKSRALRVEDLGARTIFLPGEPAVALLSSRVEVPEAARAPTEHVAALLKVLSEQSGIPISLDTAAFGFRFDLAYSGKEGGTSQWGSTSRSARAALVDFLDRSATTTVWQVDCQIGVAPSPGNCILSLLPITIKVKDRSGNLTKRTLYYDRGGAEMATPPPPPQ